MTTFKVGDRITVCWQKIDGEVPREDCPHCGAPASEVDVEGNKTSNRELRNYDVMWGDGDIHCKKCDGFVRTYDRG